MGPTNMLCFRIWPLAWPVVAVLIPGTEILYVALPTNNSSGERVQAKSPIFSLPD